MRALRMSMDAKIGSGLLVAIGALGLLPALFSVLLVSSLDRDGFRVAWLLYVGAFCFLFVQWVRYFLCCRAYPSVGTVWAASVAYFAFTFVAALAVGIYYIWRFFQPEPLTFNGEEFPFALCLIPVLASVIPFTCLILSYLLLRNARRCT